MHALHTDRYQLTMLGALQASGMHRRQAVFEAFVRKLPPCRSYLVACGIERAVEKILALRFTDADVRYLAGADGMGGTAWTALLASLPSFRFTGSISAIPEGTVVFPGEPLVRVEAPLEEAQLVETLLLSILNHDVRIATKAARCVMAAKGRTVVEFGTRRTHEEAAIDTARAAYAMGFAGTSNEEAGRRFGIPVFGTVAHSFILAHPEVGEAEAFRRYCKAFPDNTTLLVDTYDTLRGVERAAVAAGPSLKGIRLDSGDLARLAHGAREVLDRCGAKDALIVASSDLDEYRITALLNQNAPIDVFGIGTQLVCVPDQPALGAVYKLVAIEGSGGDLLPVAKLSSGKATYPGAKQVFRRIDGGQTMVFDEVALASEDRAGEALLETYVENGVRVREPESLPSIRARCAEQIGMLPTALKVIPNDERDVRREVYPVERTMRLLSLYDQAIAKGL